MAQQSRGFHEDTAALEPETSDRLRGGDFALVVGQDFSIGYLEHTRASVHLYLQESFTFRALSPEAAIPLRYPSA